MAILDRLSAFLRGGSSTPAVTKREILEPTLPDSVVEHDGMDEWELETLREDSPRFKRATVDEAPRIALNLPELPPPPDVGTSPAEFQEWQKAKRERIHAEEEAPIYKRYPELTGDLFYGYHTHDAPEIIEEVDPAVRLHGSILRKVFAQDDFAEARYMTRNDPMLAAFATMGALEALDEALQGELSEHTRKSQEFEERRKDAQEATAELEAAREEIRDAQNMGQAPTPADVARIKQLVEQKHEALGAAQELAEPNPVSQAVMDAIHDAAAAGLEAAEGFSHTPSFGAGMGEGEPTYESPEQAFDIAKKWRENPKLRAVAERYGRLDRDIRFKRSKRVEGGNDEIVDVGFGDNLRRALPSELAKLADPDLEDLFLLAWLSGEMLEFKTEGEENAGRGPIVLVLDGSQSMEGERNIWSRAIAMSLLNIARIEKRDFACVEFASGGQVTDWTFLAREPMDAQMVVDMCSHFFAGGTAPILGTARGAEILKTAPEFRKADLVMVGDGEAGFGPEDETLRTQLTELGVRIFGIGIGGSFSYLERYCEDGHVVSVHDFELTDPSAATAELAVRMT